MAFAPSTTFTSGSQYTPFEAVSSFKSRFSSDTKIMIALGGWGDTAGFSAGVKDNTTIQTYAKNVAAMLDSVGADGVGKIEVHVSLQQIISVDISRRH
jgi:chitinase